MFRPATLCAILSLFITLHTIPGMPVKKDMILEVNFDIPEMVQNLTGVKFLRSRSKSQSDNTDGSVMFKFGLPDINKAIGTLQRLIQRRTFAYVEIGPGAFKTEIIDYPPNFHESQLKKLLRLKQAIQDRQRVVNEGTKSRKQCWGKCS